MSYGLRTLPGVTGLLLILIGAALIVGGGWLLALDGTWYYLIAGLGTAVAGILMARGSVAGLICYSLVMILTILWSIWEAGIDGWALMPRLVAPALLGLWIYSPAVAGRLRRQGGTFQAASRANPRRDRYALLGCLAVILFVFGAGWGTTSDRFHQDESLTLAQENAAPDADGNSWRYYGRTPAGDRYSPLTQITPANVGKLQLAWSLRTGDVRDPSEAENGREFNDEVTPTQVGDRLYVCTPHRHVLAIDATTGKTLWEFDPHSDTSRNVYLACRGVAYFDAPPGAPCPRRIVTTTADAEEKLIELDADSGALCESFGDKGKVSLTHALGPTQPGFHFITSQPLVISNRIMLGGWIYDNQSEGEPSGVIRAYDPVSGDLAWAWDMGRPDPTAPLAQGESWTTGTSNGWGPYTADPGLNLVYIPLGNPTPDYFGGNRRPFDDVYSSTLVALDIATGKERWHFQTVHHDLWDFDLPVGPSLIDLPAQDGTTVPALVQTTKQGQLFLLDRRDGHPLAEVREQMVASGDTPGERYSPTQPYSVGMPSLTPAALTETDLWGVTPLDQMVCRIQFRRMAYTGLFTPPSRQGNIGYPAFDGVVDWYGATIDPIHKILIANSSYMPFTYQLVPHDEAVAKGYIADWKGWNQPYVHPKNFNYNPQYGTPFAVIIKPWLNALHVPCNRPPWGLLTAIDLTSRKIAWQRPVGTTENTGPWGLRIPFGLPTGIFSMGGNIVTGSGLIFLGATADQHFRAFDESTGKTLWDTELPAGGQATPITYMGSDGRQYVVIAAGGHGGLGTRSGDYIQAYALPAKP